MEGTSLPPQPSTPKTLPVETGDIGSISSMTLSEPSSPQITQEGNGPKQRSTTTVNSYELPLQKLTFSETPSDTNMIEGAQLLYGQVASYKPRPREDSAAQATPSRRNAIVRLTPLPLFESPQNEHEEIYNGVAYWYQNFRLQIWSPVASMVGIHWEKAEELGWQMGREEIIQRSNRLMAFRPAFRGKSL
ncbi:hypothetical protein OAory_01013960 [Aspergillus oryzae]|uniref:Uncharacterized protein n=1 Tax=Aspergillus oryzae TaxID=5062 RepID=A0A1S9DX87_ASPOZ|nr:hypothetical protein OAory_01013960 [Aspergillus oryzae]